jgi:hypothetical protein
MVIFNLHSDLVVISRCRLQMQFELTLRIVIGPRVFETLPIVVPESCVVTSPLVAARDTAFAAG